MEWTEWDKKRIFIRLKTGDCYNGVVVNVDNGFDNSGFITIIDKFNEKVSIAISEISKIKEEKEGFQNGIR
jgi:small nuclear ribonucleoprotein (snRNP)-like protein